VSEQEPNQLKKGKRRTMTDDLRRTDCFPSVV
jgi:hypothetical protein